MANRLLLLGAGASVDAGLPSTLGLTRAVIQGLDQKMDRLAPVARFVLAGLSYSRARSGQRDYDKIDIEALYAALLVLADRDANWLAPFVATWLPELEDFDRASSTPSPFALPSFFRDLGSWIDQPANRRIATMSLGRSFQDAVGAVSGLTRPKGMFRRTAGAVVQEMRNLLIVQDASSTAYLSPLVTWTQRQGSAVIASLNYDNLVETVFRDAGVALWRGIDEWSTGRSLCLPPTGASLLKLHGSIDWVLRNEQHAAGKLPHTAIHEATPEEMANSFAEPAIVFGENKLTAEGPFLELLSLFSDALTSADVLTIVGYSFRDAHINEYIRRWLNDDDGRTVEVVDPVFPALAPSFSDDLDQFCRDRMKVSRYSAGEILADVLDRDP